MKRMMCAVLSLLMLVSVLSVGVMNVSAAGGMTTSDAAVEMLKQFEGFRANAYPDNGQYSIGYGTSCNPEDYPDGITEAQATELLKAALVKCEETTNYIANKHGLTFTQNQFDALVLFAYNLGYGWYVGNENGSLYQAIVNGTTGNDFIYAMTMWCKASNTVHTGLVSRRLAEANLYLNGVYSKNPPANYSYVRYNGNGGSVSVSVQGYDASALVGIKGTATREGYYFAGWYTAEKGGEKVTILNAATKGKTLYAHWEKNTPVATGKVTASSLFIRSSASPSGNVVGGLENGAEVEIFEITTVGNTKWGRIDKGWISLAYVKLDSTETPGTDTPGTGTETPGTDTTPDTVIASGTVTASSLFIRKGPGTGHDSVGSYVKGNKVEFFEIKTVGTTKWGRTDKGWISMAYVKLDETEPETPGTGTETPGTGTETPGTGTETPGTGTETPGTGTETPGTGTETPGSGTETPGTGTETPGTDTAPDTVIASGTVTTSPLYIRKGPGTGYDRVGSYVKGDKVEFFEIETVGTTKWGRTDKGWISLTYVKLDETEPETPGTGTETPGTGTETPGTSTAIATGTVTGTVYLRKAAGSNGEIIGSIPYGETVSIIGIQVKDGIVWGKTADGWISLNYVKMNGALEGTVDCGLNVRAGAGTGFKCVNSCSAGEKVKIYETKTVNGAPWGRTDKGWINLKYVTLSGLFTETPAPGTGTETPGTGTETPGTPDGVIATGTVTASGALTIRRGPGLGYGIAGYYSKGDKIDILEMVLSGSTTWGRTDKGWVSLGYVKLDSTPVVPPAPGTGTETPGTGTETPGTGTETPGTPAPGAGLGSGTITASSLSVRKGPGAKAAIKGTVSYGTAVVIYELMVADGVLWARTDEGWLSTNYVKLNAPLGAEVTASGLYIRSKAGLNGANVGMYISGDKVNIYETKTVSGAPWGRTDKGWINLKYVKFGVAAGSVVTPGTGTVTPGTGTETPGTGTETPGTTPETPSVEPVIVNGVIEGNALSIRSKASSSAAIVGSVSGGTAVAVYELKLADGILWGRINGGWISMNFVKTNLPLTAQITATTLSIRNQAGFDGTTVDFYSNGESVLIYETDTVNGLAWGLTSKGWISLKYVKFI